MIGAVTAVTEQLAAPTVDLDAVSTRFHRLLKWHGCGMEPVIDKES